MRIDQSNGNHWKNWFRSSNATNKTRPDSFPTEEPFEAPPPLSHTSMKIKMKEMV